MGGILAPGSLGGVQSSEAKLSESAVKETGAHLCLTHLMSIFQTLEHKGDETIFWISAKNHIKNPAHQQGAVDLLGYYYRTFRDGTVSSTQVFAFAVFDSLPV